MFFLSEETELTFDQVREAGREYVRAVTRVDTALEILRRELMEMRDLDLQLLKQLIQIGETIRRMSRSRDLLESPNTTQEMSTSNEDLTGSLGRWNCRREGLLRPDFNTVPLVRRQSEPQMCMLDRSDIARGTEKRQSCSSVDAWSVGTLGSSEDGLDLLGSVEDLIKRSSSPVSFTVTCAPPDTAEEPPAAAVPENFLRPKSHSVVAATFLTRSHLTGGHSAYSDILNRNVRLWKCRVAHAQDGRPREAVLEEEG